MLNQEENFKRIYDQYQNMVLHTAYQYLQNQEDAEEITQDVFVQVY
ncbi:MAG: RNA polymerase sigma factor, partial [Flavobacterium sp.]|nr:RNA polymerase sigma factor [Flavobacterium sp.]